MSLSRDHKIEEQIKEIVAQYIERLSNKSALLTITAVNLQERGHKAIIYFTVLPESGEESALNFLKRHRAELRNAIKNKLSIRTIPFLDVEIDRGQKALQTIENLLKSE